MIQDFFRNKEGKLVVWRFPNAPLAAGFIFAILARILPRGTLHAGFKAISMAFFFTWAYLEIRHGESMFRRVLGAIVLAIIVTSYF